MEKFAKKASKSVLFFESIYFSQDDKITEPLFVKVAPYIQGTLDIHYVKHSFNSNGVCFLEPYNHRTIFNLFMFNIILE